jgi:hypothetical protein
MIAAAGGSSWKRGCRARTCRAARSRSRARWVRPRVSLGKRNLDGAILLDDIDDIDELVRQIDRQNR